ncbi:MAG: acyl-CoA thioesterase [Gammaproteobacteria bacterium]|nr:acyl-CoA thioesterase [Gammaproteobacteria bacterium]
MKLYLRLLWLFLTYRWNPACLALGPCRTSFRVLPTDLDLLGHVNNGVYLTLMDVARMDLLLRSGLVSQLKPQGWYPVIVGSSMRFRRSLKLWQSFDIHTEVIGWDKKCIFLAQRFIRADEVVAEGVVVSRFLGPDRYKVPTADLLAAIGYTGSDPELPRWVTDWYQAQQVSSNEWK